MAISKLHRRLKTNSRKLFKVSFQDYVLTDEKIHDITITHGKNSPAGGYDPATATINCLGAYPASPNRDIKIELEPWIVEQITSEAGISASSINTRFRGVIGADYITDRGDKLPASTELSCASWGSKMRTDTRQITIASGGSLAGETKKLLSHPALAGAQNVSYPDPSYFDRNYLAETGTFRDLIDKYVTDLGTHVQQRRDGSLFIAPLTYRVEEINSKVNTALGLLRSHTLAPVEWDQPINELSGRVVMKWRESDGRLNEGGITPETSDFTFEVISFDRRYITDQTGNYLHFLRAEYTRRNTPRHSLSSVRFRIDRLLTSEIEYDRLVAAQLLALQEGDPVYFSYDWPSQIAFPYFAQQITESITPDKWEMTLHLFHPRVVCGLDDAHLPEVTPRIWEQMGFRWDDVNTTWINH